MYASPSSTVHSAPTVYKYTVWKMTIMFVNLVILNILEGFSEIITKCPLRIHIYKMSSSIIFLIYFSPLVGNPKTKAVL